MPRRKGSISGPIIYGSASVVLTATMLVGWIYVIVHNYQLTQQWIGGNRWLLVAGTLSLVIVMAVLILFSVFLARQILENRRQSTFVDSVTHELRSPLASIRLGLETMSREGLEALQQERLRSMMLGDVERLSAFIDDIVEASRIEHGRTASSVARFRLAPLAARCVEAVTRRHATHAHAIVLEIPEMLELMSDATALEIVLKNLLDNAVKYSDPPARVRVIAQARDNGVLFLDVIDEGVGIPRGKLRRVFERFYRVDEEVVRARRGTGIGLYVVRALVRGMHGQLRAHSEGLGRGTRMSIRLPGVVADAPAAVSAASRPKPVRAVT